MATWPSTLPAPDLSGYQVKRRNNLLRTEMEAGLARQRRNSVGVIYDASVTWRLTPAQKTVFDDFFENTIYSGAAWFDVSLTTDGVMRTFNARFMPATLKAVALPGMNWSISADLELQLA